VIASALKTNAPNIKVKLQGMPAQTAQIVGKLQHCIYIWFEMYEFIIVISTKD
jgi:hypothetical protein